MFSKNGAAFTHPWLLMEMADMMAIYSGESPPHVIVYRLKDSD